jgi:large conductance mechanosensitive channel
MKMLKDFKEFAVRGNVLDLAVGVVIGGAFGKIIASLVNDIIMPLISVLTGGVSFTDLKIIFTQATDTSAEVALRYGSFIQNIIDFIIIAFSIFMVIRALMKFKKKEEVVAAPEPTPDPSLVLLTEIRDLLKK